MHERPQDMISIDILAIGDLIRDGDIMIEAHSTSTLIRSGNVNIVVDTSSEYMLHAIKTSFKQIGVLPKDVSIVVLTHMHDDHCSNNHLFKKAKFYVRKEECPSEKNFIPVSKDIEIAPNVKLMHTPGHTEGSMSVLVESDKRYAIAGDAIPLEDNYRRMVPPRINCNAKEAMESIKSLTVYADVIIPGHGFPFMKDTRK